MPPEICRAIIARVNRDATVFEIDGAGHHVLLDQPLGLVAGLRAVLASWL